MTTTALRWLADPRWRPAWHGSLAAAALAVFIMTGAIYWVARPWPLAAIGVLAAVLLAAWHGLFRRHGTHAAPRGYAETAGALSPAGTSAYVADVTGHVPQLRETIVYAGHSPDWAPRFEPDLTPPPFPPGPVTPRVLADRYGPDASGPAAVTVTDDDVTGWIPEEHGASCACGLCAERRVPAQVTVTDDPPAGKHEKPRAYLVHGDPEPYCSTCSTAGHWRGEGCGTPAVVDELITRRRGGHVADAIAGHLRDAGLKVYDGGEDDALESMWTRAMGGAVAAIEGARKP